MIASVRGPVLSAAGTLAVVEVGGVGMAVQVTPQHALTLRVGHEALLHTALIVRDDDLSLFGFATREELTVFDLLRGVTGVGPKSALGVLAALSPDEVARAIGAEDDAAFRKVSGIGPKTAKLITVSLAGKLVPVAPAAAGGATTAAPRGTADSVLAALVGLGWAEKPAAQAVDEVLAEVDDATRGSVPTVLRLALSRLGPQR
ncbi:Holliday junction branch migration protein RuvA [Schumannella sp. 10F1B-5-1]|uniref:Holliday junction branch migration protein RuvA n=1 Tax=Schumannella sp. 10F1B-5-1 TaxID=2590780 RepID=UPI001131CAFA|nr:Holliday junction branch migration protein RuvA [Schumannella sp. 10F1B-5-1]TPW71059.1 Holliday junction branch migration protein RuvA [Schumannella sp. 10F1B-5-1]